MSLINCGAPTTEARQRPTEVVKPTRSNKKETKEKTKEAQPTLPLTKKKKKKER
jgi:hypothetical protein